LTPARASADRAELAAEGLGLADDKESFTTFMRAEIEKALK